MALQLDAGLRTDSFGVVDIPPMRCSDLIWSAERTLMRLEALLAAHPQAALLWRIQTGLVESVRSAEMEEQVADRGRLLLALVGNPMPPIPAEAVGQRIAQTVYGMLCSAHMGTSLYQDAFDIDQGAQVSIYDGEVYLDRFQESVDLDWSMEAVRRLGADHHLPLLPRLAAIPALLRSTTGTPLPLTERLWIMLADNEWRQLEPVLVKSQPPVEPLLRTPISARWLVSPASLLSHDGVGIWEPSHPHYLSQFMAKAERWLMREVDVLLSIIRWQSNKLAAYAEKGRGESRQHLVDLISVCPILDSEFVARRLRLHPRSALRLLQDAARDGIIDEVMGRYNYRIWATPTLANWIAFARNRRPARQMPAGEPRIPPLRFSIEPGTMAPKDQREDSLAKIMADLDEVGKAADRISKSTLSAVEETARG